MDNAKKWYTSTTIQGGIINALVLADVIFKMNIGGDELNSLVVGIFGVIGTVAVIYGRFKARTVIKS